MLEEAYINSLKREKDELLKRVDALVEADRMSEMMDNFYHVSGRYAKRMEAIASMRKRILEIDEILGKVKAGDATSRK